MATLTIFSKTDIARTRNTVHKLLLAQRCSPNLAARSVAAINILTESTLRLDIVVRLDVGVILRHERKTVELGCDLDLIRKAMPRVDVMQESLTLVVNDLQIDTYDNRLNINMRLW
jgi:hypothetical protein